MGHLQVAVSTNKILAPTTLWIILLIFVLTQVVPQGASWQEPQSVTGSWVTKVTSKYGQEESTIAPMASLKTRFKSKGNLYHANYPVLSHLAGCHIHVHTEGEAMNFNPQGDMSTMSPMSHWSEPQTWPKPLECSDVLCLVQGILSKAPQIILIEDIDVSESLPLPEIFATTTIMGACGDEPCIIDGGGMGQVFIVGVSGTLTLKNLEITGGACNEGSAVLVSGNMHGRGGRLLALNVLFHNNTAFGGGGAIMVKAGGLAHIRSCVFEDNMASKGAALYVGSTQEFPMMSLAKAHCGLSTCVTVINTAFWHNEASWGGAIYVDDVPLQCSRDGGAKFECTTCSFVNNTAWVDGGAILLAYISSGAIGHLKMTTFWNNTAMNSGGDVELQAGRGHSHGAELDAYMTEFSGTDSKGGHAVVVNSFANGNFVRCKEKDDSTVYCGRRTCHFCPSKQDQYLMPPSTNLFLKDPSNSDMCPSPPPPLCTWIPQECVPPPPSPPPPSPPPPSPPPPSPPPPSPPPPSPPPPSPPPPSPPPPSPPPPSPPPPSPPPPSPPPPSPPPPSPPPPSPPPPSPPPPSPPPPSPPPPSPPPPSPPPPSPPPPSPPPPSPPPPSPPPPFPPPPPPPMPAPAPTPMLESPPPPVFSKKYGPPPPDFKTESAPDAPPPPIFMPPASSPTCECKCPPLRKGYVEGDPHFFGRHGERFDFHGTSNHNYCVVSDTKLQINMHVFQGIHKHSTFISMIGLVYQNYNILINVQPHVNESNPSFKQSIVQINKEDLPKGHEYISQSNRMTISYYPTYIHVRIPEVIDFNVTLMKPTFGIHGSGANYINFQIREIKVSPMVHGILGQTYQETKEVYMKLHNAHHTGMTPTQATKIFIDGSEDDYLTSGIFAADCKFCKFEGQKPFPANVKKAFMIKAKQMLTFEDGEELVKRCAGIGDPAILCVDIIDNWFN